MGPPAAAFSWACSTWSTRSVSSVRSCCSFVSWSFGLRLLVVGDLLDLALSCRSSWSSRRRCSGLSRGALALERCRRRLERLTWRCRPALLPSLLSGVVLVPAGRRPARSPRGSRRATQRPSRTGPRSARGRSSRPARIASSYDDGRPRRGAAGSTARARRLGRSARRAAGGPAEDPPVRSQTSGRERPGLGALALEPLDVVGVLEGECDVVEPVQQALPDLGVDVERYIAAVERDDLALEVDGRLVRLHQRPDLLLGQRAPAAAPIFVQFA